MENEQTLSDQRVADKLLSLSRQDATAYGLYLLGYGQGLKAMSTVGSTPIAQRDIEAAKQRLMQIN